MARPCMSGEARNVHRCCVSGDDWQSIYGWRGSSPSYFMEFNKEFPSPSTTRVMLSDNYRSHQHIIDAAEHIVRAAPAIPGKKAKASGEPKPLQPVNVLERDDQGLGATACRALSPGSFDLDALSKKQR